MAPRATFGGSRPIADTVRQRIERGGERLWSFEDFRDLTSTAVAQALSRLTRQGVLQRLSKGVYYRPRQTTFGKSLPNPAVIQKLASRRKAVFPSGIAAANLLGFTTQMASRGEVATSALSLPRKLMGSDTVVHTRRPEAWASLSDEDAALLDFLRRAGSTSELSDDETLHKTLALFSEKGCFERLLNVVDTEPPRVRAVMGAIGEQIGKPPAGLRKLRDSLNPFSRFDFGALDGLRHAKDWQARDHRLQDTRMFLDTEDEAPFRMRLLHFRRTFLEKMFAIHGKVELLKRDGRQLGTYASSLLRPYFSLQDSKRSSRCLKRTNMLRLRLTMTGSAVRTSSVATSAAGYEFCEK